MKIKIKKIALVTLLLFAAALFVPFISLAATEEYIVVEVKQGDTLGGIAARHLKNPVSGLKEVCKFNGIENPDFVKVGTKLKIPARLLKNPPAKSEVKTAETPPPKTPAKPVEPVTPTKPSEPVTPAKPSEPKTPTPIKPTETPKTPTSPISKEPLGTTIFCYGDVVRTKPDASSEDLKFNAVISNGDKIATDDLSFCTISLGKGTIVLGPATSVTFMAIDYSGEGGLPRVYIALQKGIVKIDSTSPLDLRVKTDYAVLRAGVANFVFRADEGAGSFIDVYTGQVEVMSGADIKKVSVGQGIVVEGAGKITEAVDLPPAPLLIRQEVNVDGEMHYGAKWEDVSQASSFRIEVALDEAFTKPVYFGGYAGSSIDFNFISTYPKGKYYFRLICVDKQGLWSAPSNSIVYDMSIK